jgi:hypothetical protein
MPPTVQLVSVQVLGSRVALATALVWTLELLVEALATASPLAGAVRVGVEGVIGVVVVSVAAAASGVGAVGGGRRGGLAVVGRVHFVGTLHLGQLGPSCWVHVEYLRHERRAGVGRRRVAWTIAREWLHRVVERLEGAEHAFGGVEDRQSVEQWVQWCVQQWLQRCSGECGD